MLEPDTVTLVIFTLDRQRYALHLASVERVLPMLAVTPLPDAPEIVTGVFTIGGRTIPAINLRRRFRVAERPAELADRLLVAHTGRRSVALWVDAVEEVVERPRGEIVPADTVLPGLGQIEGLLTLADGLVLIHDLDQCLSLEEEHQLAQAMGAGRSGA